MANLAEVVSWNSVSAHGRRLRRRDRGEEELVLMCVLSHCLKKSSYARKDKVQLRQEEHFRSCNW